MAISHKDHDHPNTPAARAACRKAFQTVNAGLTLGNPSNPPGMTVVPRRRGDGGVVAGMKATKPKASTKALKRENTRIKSDADLADVPRMLAYGARLAWAKDWDVTVGERFNAEEARIVIHGDKAEVALVWKDTNPGGVNAIFVRNWDSSVTYRVDGIQRALELADHTSDGWDEHGNLVG